MTPIPNAVETKRVGVWRWLPLLAVVLLLALLYAFGLLDNLAPARLAGYKDRLADIVARRPLVAALVYVLAYAAAVGISIPGASVFTALGGFLFGALLGTLLSAIAATAGATVIFLIARTSLGDFLARRAGPRLQKLRQGFHDDAFNYLLFLRLAPLFPFWVVNLAAALFGVRAMPYVVATALGILPGTFVLSYFGQNIDAALHRTGPILSPALLGAFALLALMALVPVGVRRLRVRRESGSGRE